jgi:hypothetical protein
MTRHESAKSESTSASGNTPKDKAAKRGDEQRDWADEAAEARTAADPRRVTPHDRVGQPSTGDKF